MMGNGLAILAEGRELPMWLLLILSAGTIAYAIFRPMLRRKDPLSDKPLKFGLSQQRSVERQMENLLVEMSEMARQITAQLDTRSAKLEALIKEADEKLAALKSAGSASQVSAPAEIQEPIDPRHAEIYTLSDQNMSIEQIAQKLNRPKGEVELILALRPGRVEC